MKFFLDTADIEEIKTICACGKKASMNARIDIDGKRVRSGEQILIGGNVSYRATCPDCFYNEPDTALAR